LLRTEHINKYFNAYEIHTHFEKDLGIMSSLLGDVGFLELIAQFGFKVERDRRQSTRSTIKLN
jgi:hypothetical protein